MTVRTVLASLGLLFGCVSGIVGVWYGLIFALELKPFIMPTPGAVGSALTSQWPILIMNMAMTLRTGLIGIIFSTVLAFTTAAIFVGNAKLSDTFMPYLIAIKSTPVVALAPLVMLFFGRGLTTGVIVVSIVSFLPMMVNCLQGFRAANSRHLELMHVYAAQPVQVFWKVRFPFAIPYVFAGLRTAVPAAVLGALLAEWLTGGIGIGSYILQAAAMRDLDVLWAGIVVCMGTSIALFWVTVLAEHLFVGSSRVGS